MPKRFLLLLVLVILFAAARGALAATPSDVLATRYRDAFEALGTRGIVRGYPDGTGRPFSSLNRVEALKVLMSLQGNSLSSVQAFQQRMPPISLFRDVNQREWYAPYVEAAFRDRLVTGYPDRTFRPARAVTTEEAIALLMRSYHEPGSAQIVRSTTAMENSAGQWFTPYINVAIEKNLISSQERMRLGTPITRGQFFDMVHRMEVIRRERLSFFNRPEPRLPTVTSYESRDSGSANPQPATRNPQHQYASTKSFAITIPSLGITDLSLTHPSNASNQQSLLAPLKNGVGHLFSYPGKGGKILVYGHSSAYAWDVSPYTKIFRRINQLNVGDLVYVTYGDTLHVYKVTHERSVPASDMSAYRGTGEELILYTCWPPDSIKERYLVFASPVQKIALR